jgi:methyl-accepting chemotaxis protein
MLHPRHLPLSARLGGAFGLVAVLLLAVAVLGISRVGAVKQDVDDLGVRSLRAQALIGSIADRTGANAQATTQHLYVYDGDLETEDSLQRGISRQFAATDRETSTLSRVVAGTSLAGAVKGFDAANRRFKASVRVAIARSRHETVTGDDDRNGSRDYYLKVVDPASDAASTAAAHALDAVRRDGAATATAAASQASSAIRTIWILTIVALLVAVGAAVWVVRSITRPVALLAERLQSLDEHCLAGLTGALEASAAGDLTQTVTPVTTPVPVLARDELGRLSERFNAMLAKAQASIESYNAMRASLGALLTEVSASAGTVSAASQQMASTSDEAGRAVGEIASAVGDVAQGAERQVRMVESTRTAVQEAARAASTGAEFADSTATAAQQARDVAREGVEAAGEATAAIRQVADSSAQVGAAIEALAAKSERIGGIVATITGISEQTNLLALNAAIEAARAGEQGRGFAVVAEEVRKLAEESQDAAREISGLIAEIQEQTRSVVGVVADGAQRTEDGVATVERTREAFEAIGSAVEEMSGRVGEIAAAVAQITSEAQRAETDIAEVAAVAEQSSASAEQVSASTEETSASTEQIAASASDLASTAETLERLVGRFRVGAA